MNTGEGAIILGDALTVLRTLPDASVNCCITSPPYYGLRDYGTAAWDGGDSACEHTGVARRCDKPERHDKQSTQKGSSSDKVSRNCLLCGARRIDQQIGLESTPAEYVARLVEVFREVRRVLRDDGTCWINIGDSYATGAGKACSPGGGKQGENFAGPRGYRGTHEDSPKHAQVPDAKNLNACIPTFQPNRMPLPGLKPKDLIGIPWMLAFALRGDGWYLRQDIIWHKPNPMPESVRDRCTKAHEYVFLLSKSARYYCDMDAVSERATYAGKIVTLGDKSLSKGQANGIGIEPHGNGSSASVTVKDTRNLRSVWTLATLPTPEAHFATYPIELPETCLLAGTTEGGTVLDPFCGAGTTMLACLKNGREFIGIELSADYIAIANARARKYYPLLASVEATA